MIGNIKGYRLVLASNSPRRQELLHEMGYAFDVVVKRGIDESFPTTLSVYDVPEFLAKKKAEAYKDILADGRTLLLTSDTIVVHDGRILGKPGSLDEARCMLKSLSGKTHQVISGVALTTDVWQRSFADVTSVHMRSFTDEVIDYYVDNYKPLDKAGAYGIQEWIGLVGIDSIDGSYHNVMGLPTQRLFDGLRTII
jgi:septum formation protein